MALRIVFVAAAPVVVFVVAFVVVDERVVGVVAQSLLSSSPSFVRLSLS